MESIENILVKLKNASCKEEREESVKAMLELIDQTSNESKRGSLVSGFHLQIYVKFVMIFGLMLSNRNCT